MKFNSLAEKTKKSIKKAHLDKGCITTRHASFNIRIGPNSVDRASNILNSLIKIFETKNIKIFLKEEPYETKTCVTISGITFELDLYEKINIIKKEEKDWLGRNLCDYIPNGKLVLRIKNAPYQTRSEWSDGKKQRLEDVLDSFVEGLYKAVAKEQELQKERQRWHEEYLKKEEAQRQAALEQQQFDALEKDAMRWYRYRIIRSYVKAMSTAYIRKNGKIDLGGDFEKWRVWALQQTDMSNHFQEYGSALKK